MITILKFKGYNTHNRKINNYQGLVEVEKDGVVRTILLPVYRGTSSSAASAARVWRKIPGNMERLEKAFDESTHVKAIKAN